MHNLDKILKILTFNSSGTKATELLTKFVPQSDQNKKPKKSKKTKKATKSQTSSLFQILFNISLRKATFNLQVTINNRDDWIRTSGPFVPNEVRYQAALHPVKKICLSRLVYHNHSKIKKQNIL